MTEHLSSVSTVSGPGLPWIRSLNLEMKCNQSIKSMFFSEFGGNPEVNLEETNAKAAYFDMFYDADTTY